MDAVSLSEKADVLYQKGKFDEALSFYDKAIETNAKDPTLYNRRGLALCRLGRHEEAILSFDAALKIDPHYTRCPEQQRRCFLQTKEIR